MELKCGPLSNMNSKVHPFEGSIATEIVAALVPSIAVEVVDPSPPVVVAELAVLVEWRRYEQ